MTDNLSFCTLAEIVRVTGMDRSALNRYLELSENRTLLQGADTHPKYPSEALPLFRKLAEQHVAKQVTPKTLAAWWSATSPMSEIRIPESEYRIEIRDYPIHDEMTTRSIRTGVAYSLRSKFLECRGICGIYAIHNNQSGKVYVGASVNVAERWVAHRTLLKRGRHHAAALMEDFREYGEESFTFALLEICEIDVMKSRENYWITNLKAHHLADGYNGDVKSHYPGQLVAPAGIRDASLSWPKMSRPPVGPSEYGLTATPTDWIEAANVFKGFIGLAAELAADIAEIQRPQALADDTVFDAAGAAQYLCCSVRLLRRNVPASFRLGRSIEGDRWYRRDLLRLKGGGL